MKYRERFELVQSLDEGERRELAKMLVNYLGPISRANLFEHISGRKMRYPTLADDELLSGILERTAPSLKKAG